MNREREREWIRAVGLEGEKTKVSLFSLDLALNSEPKGPHPQCRRANQTREKERIRGDVTKTKEATWT